MPDNFERNELKRAHYRMPMTALLVEYHNDPGLLLTLPPNRVPEVILHKGKCYVFHEPILNGYTYRRVNGVWQP